MSTRESIKASQWKKDDEPVKGRDDEALRKNTRIRLKREKIYALFDEYRVKAGILSRDGFKALIDKEVFNVAGKSPDTTLYLTDLFPRYVSLHKNELGKRRQSRYPLVCERIRAFCKDQYRTEKFELTKLNMEFHYKFKDYLIEKYKHAPETYNAYLKVLDAVVRSAYESGLIQRYPFEGCRYKYVPAIAKRSVQLS